MPPVMRPSTLRWCRGLLLAGYLVLAGFGSYFLLFHSNPLQIDGAGHVASAELFRRGFFHDYVDHFFQGGVANLSYPPLEDALLAGLTAVTGADPFRVYAAYLAALWVAFLASLAATARVFRSLAAECLVLAAGLFLANPEKPGLIFFQGLSFVDLAVTGLSAETLAFLFFLALVRDLAREKTSRVGIWIALALASHLVVGPAAVLLTATAAVLSRRSGLWAELGLGVLAASAFLVPFLEARGVFYASTIVKPLPYFLPILAVLAALWPLRRPGARTWAVAALLLSLPAELFQATERWLGAGLFPSYHYYRLAILALYLVVFAIATTYEPAAQEAPPGKLARRLRTSLAFLLLLFLARDFPPYRPDPASPAHRAPVLTGSLPAAFPPTDPRRTFFVPVDRPSDGQYPAFAAIRDGGDQWWSQGLYWESSRNQTLLSSHLATLLGSSNLVLDYWYYLRPSCAEWACFFDHFAARGNVGRIAVPSGVTPAYFEGERLACLADAKQHGTPGFDWQAQTPAVLAGQTFELYALQPRADKGFDAALVEGLAADRLTPLAEAGRGFFAEPMNGLYDACRTGRRDDRVWLAAADLARLTPLPTVAPNRVGVRRRASGDYQLQVESPGPAAFLVKLSWYPGFELRDARGERLPLVPVVGGMVGVGTGELTLRYRPTAWRYLGYGASLLALVMLAIRQLRSVSGLQPRLASNSAQRA
jgi:hypothetical protein